MTSMRELTEHDVQISQDGVSDDSCSSDADRHFNCEGKSYNHTFKDPGEGAFGNPAEGEACERYAKLARGEHARDI